MQVRRQSLKGTPKNANRKSKFPYARVLEFSNDKFT